MYDDFYTKLENGRIEPITFWNDHASKMGEPALTQFYIGLLGIIAKEEKEGRGDSSLHRCAIQLAIVISQQSNIQRQVEKEKLFTSEDEKNSKDEESKPLPLILQNPEIRKDFDKAIQIGILENYCTLKASKMLLACFCWGICKRYNMGTIAKSGKDKGGFAADWTLFSFIKNQNKKDIDLRQAWQNAKNKYPVGKFNPLKLHSLTIWEPLCNELGISE